MAHRKAGGSTKLGRDSISKRLGVKLSGGQKVKPGMIIIRQRGTKFLPGTNVRKGADDTLYAATEGVVNFKTIRKRGFDRKQKIKKVVEIK